MMPLVLLILVQVLGLGLGLEVTLDGSGKAIYESQDVGEMKQDNAAEEAEAVNIDAEAVASKISMVRRQPPSSGNKPTGHTHKSPQSLERGILTPPGQGQALNVENAGVPQSVSMKRSTVVKHGSKAKQDQAEGATESEKPKSNDNDRHFAEWPSLAEQADSGNVTTLDTGSDVDVEVNSDGRLRPQAYAPSMHNSTSKSNLAEIAEVHEKGKKEVTTAPSQTPCYRSKCTHCSSCLTDIEEMCHYNSAAVCLDPTQPWYCDGPSMQGCYGAFGGPCYYKVLCHDPCVCDAWKSTNCRSRTDGRCSGSRLLLALGGKTASSKSPQLPGNNTDGAGSAEVSLIRRQSSNASTMKAAGSQLDETLEDKCRS